MLYNNKLKKGNKQIKIIDILIEPNKIGFQKASKMNIF